MSLSVGRPTVNSGGCTRSRVSRIVSPSIPIKVRINAPLDQYLILKRFKEFKHSSYYKAGLCSPLGESKQRVHDVPGVARDIPLYPERKGIMQPQPF
jgi:hypothetical protein